MRAPSAHALCRLRWLRAPVAIARVGHHSRPCIHHRRRWFGIQADDSNDSGQISKPFYITTPIFYVNGPPHIGHLYSALMADARARTERLSLAASDAGMVFLSTGTDEHGIKVAQAAAKANQSPLAFTDAVALQYESLFTATDIHYNDFIRTTEPQHSEAVSEFWRRLVDSGDVYVGKHEGWYCAADECFVPESTVTTTTDPATGTVTATSGDGHRVEWASEENYMFRLSAYQSRLIDWLTTARPIQPTERLNEVLSFLQSQPLHDLSITRARSRLEWGIAVPGDSKQTIYVWLDALINYLTVTGWPRQNERQSLWPVDVHLVGKDILRFHAIYWPAFLMSAGLPLPHSIVSHSHWTVNNRKMSKSLGNVIDPNTLLTKFNGSVDCVRYFLLYNSSLIDDSNYSDNECLSRYNSDLCDNFGNLLARLTSKALLRSNTLPPPPKALALEPGDHQCVSSICMATDTIINHYRNFAYQLGIEEIMKFLRVINLYVSHQQPWKLVKLDDSKSQSRLNTVMYIALEGVRIAALLMQPIVPSSAGRVLDRLAVPSTERQFQHAVFGRASARLNDDVTAIVFPKLEVTDETSTQPMRTTGKPNGSKTDAGSKGNASSVQ